MLTNVTLSSIKLPSPAKVAVGTFVLKSIFRIHAEKVVKYLYIMYIKNYYITARANPITCAVGVQ